MTFPSERARLAGWLRTGESPSVPVDEMAASVLAGAAAEHGLAALLQESTSGPGHLWPRTAEAMLRRAAEDDFTRTVRQLDRAGRIQELLAVRGIRCLPLKGAALAERFYDSVAHRPMVDVDVLVLDDWPDAVRTLEQAGFRHDRTADHAAAFIDGTLGTVVELHREITSCARLFPLDLEGAWARSAEGTGLVKRLPSTEDLLVHLALHAVFQHGLSLRLVQFLDFRRLLERDPPDPAVIARIAVGAPARRAVALALWVARAVVAAPIAPALRELITAWLPTKVWRYIESRMSGDVSRLLTPAEPPLAWIRWQIAAQNRRTLIRETLRIDGGTGRASTSSESIRALRLLFRWARPTLRSLRTAPWA